MALRVTNLGLVVTAAGLKQCGDYCCTVIPGGPCEPPVPTPETCTTCGEGECIPSRPHPDSAAGMRGPGRWDWSEDHGQWIFTPLDYPGSPGVPCCCLPGSTSAIAREDAAVYVNGCLVSRYRRRLTAADGGAYSDAADSWNRDDCNEALARTCCTPDTGTDANVCQGAGTNIPLAMQSSAHGGDGTIWGGLVWLFGNWSNAIIGGTGARGWIHIGCRSLAYLIVYGSGGLLDPAGTWYAGSAHLGGDHCGDDSACGACCAQGFCFDYLESADCTAIGGTFAGAGTNCFDDAIECPVPCCTEEGCTDTGTFAECAAAGGIVMGGGSCDAECGPDCSGACCVETSPGVYDCTQTTKSACDTAGGTWGGLFSSCDEPFPCPHILGACCQYCGGCTLATGASCIAMGGEYGGDETDCETFVCSEQGACCVELQCMIATQACCAEMSGEWFGAGTDCDPDPCGPNEGACCHGDGSCTEGTIQDCAGAGGTYQGHGTECIDTVCIVDPSPVCHACCIRGGGCSPAPSSSTCPAPHVWVADQGCPGQTCDDTVDCSQHVSQVESEGGGDFGEGGGTMGAGGGGDPFGNLPSIAGGLL